MLTKIVEAGILIRLDRGMYIFNNELKDLSNNNYEKAVLQVEYEDKKKTITIDVGGNDK